MASSTPTFELYAELDVLPTATTATIVAAYRRLSLVHHPDKAPPGTNKDASTAKMMRLNHARQVLTNPDQRRAYDLSRRASTTRPSTKRSTPNSNGQSTAQEKEYDFTRTESYSAHSQKKQQTEKKTKDATWEAELAVEQKQRHWEQVKDLRDEAKAGLGETQRDVELARRVRDLTKRHRGESTFELEEALRALELAKHYEEFAQGTLRKQERRLMEAEKSWKKALQALEQQRSQQSYN